MYNIITWIGMECKYILILRRAGLDKHNATQVK